MWRHWSWVQKKVLFHQPLELPPASPHSSLPLTSLTVFLGALQSPVGLLLGHLFKIDTNESAKEAKKGQKNI